MRDGLFGEHSADLFGHPQIIHQHWYGAGWRFGRYEYDAVGRLQDLAQFAVRVRCEEVDLAPPDRQRLNPFAAYDLLYILAYEAGGADYNHPFRDLRLRKAVLKHGRQS